MRKVLAFFEHVVTAIRYGDWYCGYEQYKGKPQALIALMPYDGWHFCVHLWRFYISVSYPWTSRGEI